MKKLFLLMTASLAVTTLGPAHGQAIGSLGNFDCVNDTGQTAYGFEIEVDNIQVSDITREFPSNFLGQEYVQRFGIPTVAAFDETATGGVKGVRVTWAATWDPVALKWKAKWGSYVSGALPPAGDGVLYLAKPTATQGDSCWLLGQGAGYATSGCDHFGLSFTPTAVLGPVTYHWKVPDPANPGTLVNAQWISPQPANPYVPVFAPAPPIPAMPVQVYVPPVAPGVASVVIAEADPPENKEAQWGPAFWVKVYTSQSKVPIDLDKLQKNLIPLKNGKGVEVSIDWSLLQQRPAANHGGRNRVDNDKIKNGNVALVRRYEYYRYIGVYDPLSHEVICAPPIVAGTKACDGGPQTYTYVDPVTHVSHKINEKGKFLGAHMNGFNLP
jgi:hypothetical protein